MEKIKIIATKLKGNFEKLSFSIPFCVILGILIGIISCVVNQIDVLENSFLASMAYGYGYYVIIGLAIIMLSNKSWHSAINCFSFFAIYVIVFYSCDYFLSPYFAWGYVQRWLFAAVCTAPAAFLLWYYKKDKIIGAFVLAMAIFMLIIEGLTNILAGLGIEGETQHPISILIQGSIFIIAGIMAYFIGSKTKKMKIWTLVFTIIFIIIGILVVIFPEQFNFIMRFTF